MILITQYRCNFLRYCYKYCTNRSFCLWFSFFFGPICNIGIASLVFPGIRMLYVSFICLQIQTVYTIIKVYWSKKLTTQRMTRTGWSNANVYFFSWQHVRVPTVPITGRGCGGVDEASWRFLCLLLLPCRLLLFLRLFIFRRMRCLLR